MKLSLLLTLFALVSCGPGKTGGSAPESSLFREFTSSNVSIPSLDLRQAKLNEQFPATDVIDCNGTSLRGNSGQVNGVDAESILISGTNSQGVIQFGHLLRVVDTIQDQCDVMSKESYSYKLNGNSLYLCNLNCLNGVYPSCQSEALACSTLTSK